MANRVLRDQCEHGRYEEHSVMWTENKTTSSFTSPCPGGREVTIDKVWVTSSGQTPNKVHAVFLIEDEATAYAKEHRQDVEEWTVGV